MTPAQIITKLTDLETDRALLRARWDKINRLPRQEWDEERGKRVQINRQINKLNHEIAALENQLEDAT